MLLSFSDNKIKMAMKLGKKQGKSGKVYTEKGKVKYKKKI